MSSYEEELENLRDEVAYCQEQVDDATSALMYAEEDLERAERELARFELNGEY